VPRLIHLNGPPGIGKSTLAQLYVDDHPGVLNLDIDRVRTLVGGWRDRFGETGEIVRPIARGMAGTHLQAGRDVIMPQYLGRSEEITRFQDLAGAHGAVFVQVVLMDTKQRSLARFADRGAEDTDPWHHQVREIVERSGGPTLLAAMHDQLVEATARWPDAITIPSEAGAIRQTYDRLTAALDALTKPG
jgi:predicted kinase